MVRSMRMLRGGSISTDTTNRPPASSAARRVGGGALSVAPEASVVTLRSTMDVRGRVVAVRSPTGAPAAAAASATRIAAM